MVIFTIPARNEARHIADAVKRLARSLELVKTIEARSAEPGARHEGEGETRIPELGVRHDGLRASGFGLGKLDWRIVVAVNGSTDGTAERAREARSPELGERLEVIECPKAGKGAAIKYAAERQSEARSAESGMEGKPGARSPEYGMRGFGLRASGLESIFGFIDADLSADPDAIPDMVEKIINDEADIVIASRWLQLKTTNRAFFRNATSWVFNLFAHALLGLKVKDAQCGLKVMNSKAVEILKNCQEDGWFLDIEFLAKARQDGLRILEVPVPWTEFRYPDRKSQIRHIQDGIGALRAMWRIRGRIARSPEPGARHEVN